MVKVKEDMSGWIMSEHGVPDSKIKVIKQTEDYIRKNGQHVAQWLCECMCEKHTEFIAAGQDIRSGHTKSCGCYNINRLIEMSKKYNEFSNKLSDEYGDYYIGWTSNTHKEFYIDADDYEKVRYHCWYEIYNKDKTYSYPMSHIDNKNIKLHQFIVGKYVDHIDRNPFNNRKNNLRKCTHQENCWNRRAHIDGSSGFAGVCWDEKTLKWRAYITINNKQKSLGYFVNKDDAVRARLKAEIEYFGEFSPQSYLLEKYNIDLVSIT